MKICKKIFLLFIVLINILNTIVYANINVDAKGYVVFDRKTKQVIFGKNIYNKMPMASTTKIMTGILAIEYGKFDEYITVSKNAQNTSGWSLDLREGDKIKFIDLLYGIMLYSANDGAIAVAEHIGGSVENFCNMMNNKAKEIGAYNTNFTSPHGLDNINHYSTPYDMAIIADYAMNNELFKKIVTTTTYDIVINDDVRTVNNTNKLLSMRENITGIKTGYTGNALYCLVSGIKENNQDLICVLLGSDTSAKRFSDSKKILEYTIDNYIQIDLKDYIKNEIEIKVDKGEIETIKAYPKDVNKIYIDKKDLNSLDVKYTILEKATLPLQTNQIVALATVYLNNSKLAQIEYSPKENFERNSLKHYYNYIVKNYVNLLKISN